MFQLIQTILIGGILVSLYAFPEHFGVSPSCILLTGQATTSCWVQDVQNRVFGTFGQPNWLAAYLIMLIPLSLSLFIKHFYEEKKSYVSLFFYSISTFLFTSVLLFTRSRSGIVALFVGMLIFGISLVTLLAISLINNTIKIKHISKNLIVSIPFICIVFSILLFGSPFTPSLSQIFKPNKQEVSVQTSVPSGTQLEVGGTESGEIRAIVWKGAINVFKRYPLFGSGVETFAYSYYKDRPVEHNNVSEWDFLYNKAHNEFLNYLSTTGVFGLGSYILILIWFFIYIVINMWKYKTSNPQGAIFLASLISGYIALCVSNFFGFSTVVVSLLFFIFPACSVLALKNNIVEKDVSKPLDTSAYFFGSITWIIAVYLIIQIAILWIADTHYALGKKYEASSYDVEAFQELKKATSLLSDEPNYHDELSIVTAKLSVSLATQNDATLAAQLAEEAIKESDLAVSQNPVHLNFYKSRARVFIFLAQINVKALDEAVRTLEYAEKLSPTDPKLPYNIAVIKQNQNKLDEAEALLLHTISLKPNYEEAYNVLAQVYESKKEYKKAIEQLQYILDHISPKNDVAKKHIEDIKKQHSIY